MNNLTNNQTERNRSEELYHNQIRGMFTGPTEDIITVFNMVKPEPDKDILTVLGYGYPFLFISKSKSVTGIDNVKSQTILNLIYKFMREKSNDDEFMQCMKEISGECESCREITILWDRIKDNFQYEDKVLAKQIIDAMKTNRFYGSYRLGHIGLDISPQERVSSRFLVEFSRIPSVFDNVENCRILCGDFEEIDSLVAQKFDVVFTSNVHQWIINGLRMKLDEDGLSFRLNRFLNRIKNVLKPNSYVVVSEAIDIKGRYGWYIDRYGENVKIIEEDEGFFWRHIKFTFNDIF
ncbi:methyltransferase domain-containing protein [Candidatus Micrarchaeota archaeon]|nr:methyltransferase domain-containing protein [Candidatus Micrarchaeota archaeon]